ncbi:MAG TPA: FAD binding domain-containing protein [Stellaceae bacterium]|nr:FAD binding domain-containing protein [Stellaceae bacterium]
MMPFDLAEPRSLEEAIALLDRDDPAVRPIAGGTALMLMMKSGLFRPQRLVSLRRIEPRHAEIAFEDGALRIGAMTRLAALEHSPLLREHAPVVVRTMRTLANVRVRNVATVGGNLAHADPHLDLPPVWIVLGAAVTIAGRAGARTLPVERLFTGYYETVLRHDEIITMLTVPPQARRGAAYLKYTARSADDWPALGIAVSFAADGGRIAGARVAVGAATPMPMRLAAAEAALEGAAPGDAAFERAGEAAAAEADIAGDSRGSAPYKRALLRVLVPRAARAALEGAG